VALEVVGAVSNAADLQSLLADNSVDVAVVDVEAMERDAVLSAVSSTSLSNTQVIVLADPGDPLLRNTPPNQTDTIGWSVLARDADSEQLAAAIRAVAARLYVFDPALLPSIRSSEELRSEQGQNPTLSTREREVLQLLARGLPNKSIAARLNISPHTVKFHVTSIMAKLRASSRTEAVTLAARSGELSL
jgi:DNA-binding NarL/FixJ family response regulator